MNLLIMALFFFFLKNAFRALSFSVVGAKMFLNGLVKKLSIAGMTLSLISCSSQGKTDLMQYIIEIKARKGGNIETIPPFVPLPKYAYPENDNRRSPFKPKKEVVTVKEDAAPNINRPKQLLESYPLDALKFVGIIEQGPKVWALISQPGGEVTKVTLGSYMGQNFGRIIRITPTALQLEETVKVSGKWQKKIAVFNLTASE